MYRRTLFIYFYDTSNIVCIPLFLLLYFANEPFKPGMDFWKFLIIFQFFHNQFCNLSRVIVWHVCTPAGSNPFTSIHQPHGDNGYVELRFDELPIIFHVIENVIVRLRVDVACYFV